MRAFHPLQALRDPQVRTAICVWIMVAGLCVFFANAMAAAW